MKKTFLNLAIVSAATLFTVGCSKDSTPVCSTCTINQSGISVSATVCDDGVTILGNKVPFSGGATKASTIDGFKKSGYTCN
jgi:hypothetical protein